MKLKNKIARTLRNLAERLDPLFPYNINAVPSLRTVTHDIQRVMVKHSTARYAYEQFPDRFDKLMREDIVMKIAQELSDHKLIKIMIEPGVDRVDYTGEIQVIDIHDDY